MKIAIILGTRPEIIKMSPIIRELQKRTIDFVIIHTNQHFSREMDEIFITQLELPRPKYNLGINNLPQGKMVGKMLIDLEPILTHEKPDWVLVQGDTNTVMAGAIAASKLGLRVGHVEAGLRSYDRTMPEELNRVVTDHVSDFLFCPTERSADIARREGIPKEQIIVSGNTIVDAVNQNLKLAMSQHKNTPINVEKYMLLTLHRPNNVDNKASIIRIIEILHQLVDYVRLPIIFPVHPRTADSLKRSNVYIDSNKIRTTNPVDYLEMLMLEKSAKLILTDSGGIQEEACILHVPCLTLRDNTERPETIDIGANILVSNDKNRIFHGADVMQRQKLNWDNPFGDGSAAIKIIDALIGKSTK